MLLTKRSRDLAGSSTADPKFPNNFTRARTESYQQIVDRIQVPEILDPLERDVRWAITRRTLGYEVQKIAREMNISADCLSTRIRRAVKRSSRRLLGDNLG